MPRLRLLLIAAAGLAGSCVLDRAGSAESHTQSSLIVDRTSQEGLGGRISTVRERTFAEMLWMRSAGEARARLTVDSAQFSRERSPSSSRTFVSRSLLSSAVARNVGWILPPSDRFRCPVSMVYGWTEPGGQPPARNASTIGKKTSGRSA